MKHKPPSGVTGPMVRPYLAGSSVKRYRLPENMVMPATKSPPAQRVARVCGASEATTRVATEWTSWYFLCERK